MNKSKVFGSHGRSLLSEWSNGISWLSGKLTSCLPVTEGCATAFNHTNFIRVSLYFRTHQPIFKCVAGGFREVKGMWFRKENSHEDIARFGSLGLKNGIAKLSAASDGSIERIVLENYVEGAINILGLSWTTSCILSVGNENLGSSTESLLDANKVVYIPQFGVISSLNVVTALAIALHVRHVSLSNYNGKALVDGNRRNHSEMSDFAFPRLPRNGDLRPIRPILYNRTNQEIMKFAIEKRIKKLAVFYENTIDLKNFGGVIRNCNAFAVEKVYYCGRRKINRQGTVGAYNYVDIEHLDPQKVGVIMKRFSVWMLIPSWQPISHQNPELSEASNKLTLRNHKSRNIFLDNIEKLREYVQKEMHKGILLVVFQESTPYSRFLMDYADFRVHVRSQDVQNTESVQRGLSPCITSAIALFYISHIMNDAL